MNIENQMKNKTYILKHIDTGFYLDWDWKEDAPIWLQYRPLHTHNVGHVEHFLKKLGHSVIAEIVLNPAE